MQSKHKIILLMLSLCAAMSVVPLAAQESGGQICLRAFQDRNANGLEDPGEPRITRGISATLADSQGVIIDTLLMEDSPNAASGTLCFQRLQAGQYNLRAVSADYNATTPSEFMTAITTTGTPQVFNFGGQFIAAAPPAAAADDPFTLTDEELRELTIRIIAASLGAIFVIGLMTVIGAIIYTLFYRPRNKPQPQSPSGYYPQYDTQLRPFIPASEEEEFGYTQPDAGGTAPEQENLYEDLYEDLPDFVESDDDRFQPPQDDASSVPQPGQRLPDIITQPLNPMGEPEFLSASTADTDVPLSPAQHADDATAGGRDEYEPPGTFPHEEYRTTAFDASSEAQMQAPQHLSLAPLPPVEEYEPYSMAYTEQLISELDFVTYDFPENEPQVLPILNPADYVDPAITPALRDALLRELHMLDVSIETANPSTDAAEGLAKHANREHAEALTATVDTQHNINITHLEPDTLPDTFDETGSFLDESSIPIDDAAQAAAFTSEAVDEILLDLDDLDAGEPAPQALNPDPYAPENIAAMLAEIDDEEPS